jgi:hypothetical protein
MLVPTITRDALASIYGVSQGYLGRLLREKRVPLPVQISSEPLWFSDEIQASVPYIKKLVERQRKVN